IERGDNDKRKLVGTDNMRGDGDEWRWHEQRFDDGEL
ncbi:hypothetical protein A2U01_0074929, partial [Trifolium medium]|nr:hypothetical protein [Trifolium medium]